MSKKRKLRVAITSSDSDAVIGYVVVYGSLMNKDSLRSTIGKSFGSLQVAKITGLRRTWLSSIRNNPNALKFWVKDVEGEEVLPIFKPCYLDVSVDLTAELIAPMVPVTENDLHALDAREAGYNRVEITEYVDTIDGKIPEQSKPIYIYIGRPEFKIRVLDAEAKIPFPYVEMCTKASMQYGEECRDNFYEHMDGKIKVLENIKLGDNQEY